MRKHSDLVLSADYITSFMRDGLVRIDEAFSEHIAEQARAILWEAPVATQMIVHHGPDRSCA